MYINKNLQEMAYDFLLEMILSEKLNIDEIYSEEMIAQKLGISRTPVRSALQRLNHDNFVDIIPYKGFKVHKISNKDIINTYQLRTAIEGYCCALIAKDYKTPKGTERLSQLKQIIEKQKEIIITCSRNTDFLETDIEFHKTLIEYAKNREFDMIFTSYINTIKYLARNFKNYMKLTYEQHNNIYNAMITGDKIKSFNSILEHLKTPTEINLSKGINENHVDEVSMLDIL